MHKISYQVSSHITIITTSTHHNNMYSKLKINHCYLSLNQFLVSFFCATSRSGALLDTHPMSSCILAHKVYYTHSYTYHVLIMPYIYPYWYHMYYLYIVQYVLLNILPMSITSLIHMFLTMLTLCQTFPHLFLVSRTNCVQFLTEEFHGPVPFL